MELVGNIYKNRNKVNIDWTDRIDLYARLWSEGPTPFMIALEIDPEDFIKTFNIRIWADVDAISKDTLWWQYLEGNASVIADFECLSDGAELVFQIENRDTVIKGDVLGYNDKIAGILDNIDDIRAYVRTHIQELYVAAEKR